MKRILFAIKKHIKIYFILVKISTISYMEYRANLFAALTMELVYLISKLMYILFIYQSGILIKGVSPDEIMLFIGTYIIMTGVYTGFFMDNFYSLPDHIRNGTLDAYITKPVSLQFLATLNHFNFVLPIPNLIVGITMVAIAWSKLGIALTFSYVMGYILILCSATFVTYSVFLAPQILAFWTVKTGAITELADKCWDFNNMPMIIYGKWMQRIGIFLIPIFFITNYPAMFIVGKLNTISFLWILLAPVIFLGLIRLFWSFAVKNYSSASS